MKKSTVFLLVIIYVVSIVVVGFFGASIRASNIYNYVTSIQVTDPTNTTFVSNKHDVITEKGEEKDQYTITANYAPDNSGIYAISLKVNVLPNNANEKKVLCKYNDSRTEYSITESSTDFNVFIVTINTKTTITGTFVATDVKQRQAKFVIILI